MTSGLAGLLTARGQVNYEKNRQTEWQRAYKSSKWENDKGRYKESEAQETETHR
jgi:hypothetical protein